MGNTQSYFWTRALSLWPFPIPTLSPSHNGPGVTLLDFPSTVQSTCAQRSTCKKDWRFRKGPSGPLLPSPTLPREASAREREESTPSPWGNHTVVASRKAEMASLPQGESNGLNYGLSDEAAPAPGRLQLNRAHRAGGKGSMLLGSPRDRHSGFRLWLPLCFHTLRSPGPFWETVRHQGILGQWEWRHIHKLSFIQGHVTTKLSSWLESLKTSSFFFFLFTYFNSAEFLWRMEWYNKTLLPEAVRCGNNGNPTYAGGTRGWTPAHFYNWAALG